MDLDYFLKKEQVIKLSADTKQEVIREMVNRLSELGLIDNANRYYAQIVHRESLESTGLGSGLAVPHARTDSVSTFISIFGIHKGIDYQNGDEEPVRYLFLSIFPTTMSTTYLYFIGMLARLFSNPEKKALLDEAGTAAKIYSFLKKEAEAYFMSLSEKSPTVEGQDSISGVPGSDLDMLIRLDRLYKMYDAGDMTQAAKEKLDEKIADIKKLIDNRSLTYYERMRKKQTNPFAIVEKGTCTGCHMEIPPMFIKRIMEQNEIPLCTHCGRFLIVV